MSDPHNLSRGTFVERAGAWQPAPAPHLSRTSASLAGPGRVTNGDACRVLRELGYAVVVTARLLDANAVA